LVSSTSTKDSNKREAGASSPTGTAFPHEFNVNDKWSHISYDRPSVQDDMDKDAMSRAVAFQCINARGAIAHGRRPAMIFETSWMSKMGDAAAILSDPHFGGSKHLKGVAAIKEELMNNGPVFSTSFNPNVLFLRENIIGKSKHGWQTNMLIVGWQQQSRGEF
jgi:hypothetical protein